MNAQDLRNSILQRAIEGKLVPQRDEEGTSKELLQEIRAEKARLIKEKKIKKTKPLPAITEDEKPFELPESWEWVRLGEIFFLQAGRNIKAAEINVESTESYQYPCYGGNGIRGFVKFFNAEGDFPIIGRQGALCGNINRATGKFYATEHAVLTHTFASTDVSWACYFLTALNLNQYATATAQPGLAVSKINHVLIPLPPLAEQKRIVAKIETFLPDLAAYDDAQTELHTLTQRFPDDMKKSLLQYAIEGKLVPQRAEEGTAKDLLREIQTEKARLIKEKKIKKTKPLPAITDDEKPFDLPESWEWVRLQSICTKIIDGDHNPPVGIGCESKYLMLSAQNINNDTINFERVRYLDEETFKKEDLRTKATKGDIFFTIVGTLGRSCVYEGGSNICFQRSVSVITTLIYNYYLKYVLDSYFIRNYMELNAKGTAQKGFYLKQVNNLCIPLPPLAEQHRIVARLEELLPLCQQLDAQP